MFTDSKYGIIVSPCLNPSLFSNAGNLCNGEIPTFPSSFIVVNFKFFVNLEYACLFVCICGCYIYLLHLHELKDNLDQQLEVPTL